MDKEKYICTLMKKIPLNKNLFVFKPAKTLIGTIDEEGYFVDNDGIKYFDTNEIDLLQDDKNMFGISNFLKTNSIRTSVSDTKNMSDEEIANYYFENVSNNIQFISLNSDGSVSKQDYDSDEFIDKFNNITNMILSPVYSSPFLGNEEIFTSEDDYDFDNMPLELVDFCQDIYGGKYNTEELRTIIDRLDASKGHLDAVIDTADLQIEAYANGDKVPDYPSLEDEEMAIERANREEYGVDANTIKMPRRNLNAIREKIMENVVGQDEAVKRLTGELVRMEESGKNYGMILMGNTGVGKSFLCENIGSLFGKDAFIVDSTQLTVPGYVGKNIEEVLWDLYIACDKDIDRAENAIIVFDEIDKKGSGKKSDISGKGVLNQLLKFLDGTTYDACADVKYSSSSIKFDTSKLTVIACGAFSDVLNDPFTKKSNPVGFIHSVDIESDKKPSLCDFVEKAGMTPEFMGRFPIQIKLNEMTPERLEEVLRRSKDSILKEEEKTFENIGVKLIATDEFIKSVCKKAADLQYGVRGLKGVVKNSTFEAFDEAYSDEDIESVILNSDTVKDPKVYQKKYKSN